MKKSQDDGPYHIDTVKRRQAIDLPWDLRPFCKNADNCGVLDHWMTDEQCPQLSGGDLRPLEFDEFLVIG